MPGAGTVGTNRGQRRAMLTQDQVRFYRENGYLHVKGLFTRDQAAEYRRETHALAERLTGAGFNIDATWGSAAGADSRAARNATKILHCHDVQFHCAAFSRMLLDERLTGAAAGIMGTENVQLHHTKMFIKPPEKGSPFPLHQDCPYFPHVNDSMIACILHFDDAPPEKGCVCVLPGSHKLGRLPHNPEGGWHLDPAEYPLSSATPCPAEAGDALFFSYLTVHGSGLNTSGEARTTCLVQMRDPADRPEKNVHISRGQGMMLRGFDPTALPWAPEDK